MNDIQNCCVKLCLVPIANRNGLIPIVNCELLIVHKCVIANKLLFVEKCHLSIFHLSHKRPNYKVNLKLFYNSSNKFIPLERKNHHLAVPIDNNLTWKKQIIKAAVIIASHASVFRGSRFSSVRGGMKNELP